MEIKSKFQDNFKIIEINGKLLSEDDLMDMQKELNNNTCWNILYDLESVTYLSSLGISFFVKSMTRARINGGEVILMNLNNKVKEIFTITKLDQIFPVVEDIKDAKLFFKKN